MSGLKLFQFDISPKSPDSFIILTSNFSIGGNSGNGNLYFRWRFSSGNRVDYVSVNNKDVSGANRITGGWGIQTDQHRENYSSSSNVSFNRPNIKDPKYKAQFILQYCVKNVDNLYMNRRAAQDNCNFIGYTISNV